MNKAHHDLLVGTPIFRGLGQAELEAVAAICEPSDAGAGDSLFVAGSDADGMYIIAHGTVEMTFPGHEMRMARFGNGQILGVAALLLGGTYPASVTAVEATRMVKIPCAKLEGVLAGDTPLAAKVYRNIAHYLAHHVAGMAADRDRPYA